MSAFALILIVKIAVTGAAVVVPMLVLSVERLEQFFPGGGSALIYRLYGVAIAALLVGYGLALMEVLAGRQALWILPIGIVSNGGAALVLWTAQGLLRAGGVLFAGTIAASFVAVWAFPGLMTAPLW